MSKNDKRVGLSEDNLENVSGGVITRLKNSDLLYKKGYRFVVETAEGTFKGCKNRDEAIKFNKEYHPEEYNYSDEDIKEFDKMVGI